MNMNMNTSDKKKEKTKTLKKKLLLKLNQNANISKESIKVNKHLKEMKKMEKMKKMTINPNPKKQNSKPNGTTNAIQTRGVLIFQKLQYTLKAVNRIYCINGTIQLMAIKPYKFNLNMGFHIQIMSVIYMIHGQCLLLHL